MRREAAAVVHIGDTHLYDGPRQADRLAALDQCIDECEGLPGLAAWLWPGDVFHCKSTPAVRNALKDRVRRMADAAPVVIGEGNHDAEGDLNIFGDLAASHEIHVVTQPTMVDADGLSVFVFPWPSPRSLGLGPAVDAQAMIRDTFATGRAALARDRRDDQRLTLAMGHVAIAGAERHAGQPLVDDAALTVPQDVIDSLGCPFLANHVHYAQDLGASSYAGSLCRLDWGEIEPKSYTVWRHDGTAWQSRRCPVAAAPLYYVEGTLSRGGWSGDVVSGGMWPTSWGGCDVRVRMRYRQSEGVVLADAERLVRQQFAAARLVEFEPLCDPDRAVRAPEVAAAQTLDEKVAAWAKVAGVVLPVDASRALAQLEREDVDALAAEVTARLQAVLAGTVAQPEEVLEW